MVAVPREVSSTNSEAVRDRELAYYENAYNSYVPGLFAQPAVVEFRGYLVRRMLRATGAGPQSRVLSVGCGIGDTELRLAPEVAHVTGVDLSPTAIANARQTAAERGVHNVDFVAGSWRSVQLAERSFDIVIAIFFLHHLPESDLQALPDQLGRFLKPGGVFYALDPSARRLAGFLGELLVPKMMKKYQTENEHPLLPRVTAGLFRAAGYETVTRWFDFTSTPVAGLFPRWRTGYRLGRLLDEGLTRMPLLRQLSSNFELIARGPAR